MRMTDEETIKNLKKLKSFHNGSYGTAINIAIKALESKEGINKCANDSCSFAMEIEDMCGDCKERNTRW